MSDDDTTPSYCRECCPNTLRNEAEKAKQRLTDAAPDMLAALNSVDQHFRMNVVSETVMGKYDHEVWAVVQAAIAKAEGR